MAWTPHATNVACFCNTPAVTHRIGVNTIYCCTLVLVLALKLIADNSLRAPVATSVVVGGD